MSSIHSAKPRTKLRVILNIICFNNPISELLFKLINFLFRIISNLIFINFKIKLYSNCEVITGPFKGLKYAEPTAVCGPIIPKLLGTYEAELIPIINSIKNNKYKTIFNVGAAEGYYCIGFSMIFKNSKIKAYEIDLEGIEYLKKNIKKNNKQKVIEIINKNAKEDIQKINKKDRNLIFSDCEGCEFDIFDTSTISNLNNTDLIIEIHSDSFYETDIEKNLKNTHEIQRVGYGTSRMIDITQAQEYDIDIKNFSKVSRENRTDFHYFLVALSKYKN